MLRKKGYIFTNKEHPRKAIMSTILGTLANITLGLAVYLSYKTGGAPSDRNTAAVLLAMVYMAAGLILGLWSTSEKDKFKLFIVLGIFINILAFGMLSLILFAGAYVE